MPRFEPTATVDTTTEENIASDPSAEVSATPWRHLFRWHFAVLLAVVVFLGAIRWRLLDMPLERDEGEYAYAGQLILQGIPPYQLAYNMKPPGTLRLMPRSSPCLERRLGRRRAASIWDFYSSTRPPSSCST